MRRALAAVLLLAPLPALAGGSLTGGSLTQPTTVTAAQIIAAGAATNSSVQTMINNTAVAKAGGDASATLTKSATNGAVGSPSLAYRAAQAPWVVDYASTNAAGVPQIAGGLVLYDMSAHGSVGGTTVVVPVATGTAVGKLFTAADLPTGTKITAVGAVTQATQTHNTNVATQNTWPLLNGAPILQIGMYQLTFNDSFSVPATYSDTVKNIPTQAQVATITDASGCIPAGTTAVALATTATSTQVYISQQPTCSVPANDAVTFTYNQQTVTFSGTGYTDAPIAGNAVGVIAQDDRTAFIQAFNSISSDNNGYGGALNIPAGNYYVSSNFAQGEALTLYTHNAVHLLPGSAPIGLIASGASDHAGLGIFHITKDPIDSGIYLNHVAGQSPDGTLQGAGMTINEIGTGSYNGDPNSYTPGYGSIAIELTGFLAHDNGDLWGYHSVLQAPTAGYRNSVISGEWEIENYQHWDVPYPDQQGAMLGFHPDCLGDTACTTAIDPGGSNWHFGILGASGSISDWLALVESVPRGTAGEVASGIRMDGGLYGTYLTTSATAGGQVGGRINSTGDAGLNSLTTSQITSAAGGISGIAVTAGGRWDLVPPVRIQSPASGTTATAHVSLAALDYVNTTLPIVVDTATGSTTPYGHATTTEPAGVVSGTVCTLVGGTLASGGTAATVKFNGSQWGVLNVGSYTAPPTGTLQVPVASTCSGVSAPPKFWPLWTTKAITVDTPGSGYNPASPPRVELIYPWPDSYRYMTVLDYSQGYISVWPQLQATVAGTATPLVFKVGTTNVLSLNADFSASFFSALNVPGVLTVGTPSTNSQIYVNGSETVTTYMNAAGVTATGFPSNFTDQSSFVDPESGVSRAIKVSGNGIATTNLRVTASDQSSVSAKTAAFTYDATMHTIEAKTAGGAFAATLPSCVTAISGRVYDLVKYDASTNAATLTAATGNNAQTGVADTISGAATVAVTTQWTAVTVKCDGAGVWLRGASL